MLKRYILLTVLCAITACSPSPESRFGLTPEGVVVKPAAGSAKEITISVLEKGIFHVVSTDSEGVIIKPSLMVVNSKPAKDWQHEVIGHTLWLKTPFSSAAIELDTGLVNFTDGAQQLLLTQAAQPSFQRVADSSLMKVSQQFNRASKESFYGLGQHQNGQMDFNGEDLELLQHNVDIGIPMVLSNKGYGVLWDNNGIGRFGNPEPYKLVGNGLVVTHDGEPGWLASYYLGDRLAVERVENTINYQYIRDQKQWPNEAIAKTEAAESGQNTAGNAVQKQSVVWQGDITPDASGVWKFQLYGSSYFKLYADGELVLDRWRQNWNPWYHNFELTLEQGKPVRFRIEWEPNAGYMSLHYNRPLPEADRHSLWLTSDVAQAINYYFIPGEQLDDVVAGYRHLTGKAVMMPKWAYGFWQSRQRYHTQDELLNVVKQYRAEDIPLDNIVQDWFYWEEDQWGSHKFDATRFPDPKQMIDDVHALNARFMISVWPKFYPTTENFQAFQDKGYFYSGNLDVHEKDWVGPGYENTDYDPYVPEAREIYWQQMKERLHVLGVDAWWMDATEPDIHSNLSLEERAHRMGPNALGSGEEYFNSFPLVHGEGVYQGIMQAQPDTRAFILTRAGWGGIQRAGSALWSGDIVSRWDDLAAQVAAGVNVSLAGIPNWTFDIGGFSLEDRYRSGDPAHIEEWRELNLRWFQFGAFVPLFRSHGEFPFREVFNISPEGSSMRESMVWYTKLRYRLMPYIYTLAADTWHRDGTIMRGLAMDFGDDPKVLNINDSYMFGPSLLIAPVSQFKAQSRQVYLPSDVDWFDFNSGKQYRGGQTIEASAPYERMPVFVKAGAIIPMGPVMQYVDQIKDAPLIIDVWAGADGEFSLYEDDGVSMGYERGEYSRVDITWNNAEQVLQLAGRQGEFPGMNKTRLIHVRVHAENQGIDGAEVIWRGQYSGDNLRIEL